MLKSMSALLAVTELPIGIALLEPSVATINNCKLSILLGKNVSAIKTIVESSELNLTLPSTSVSVVSSANKVGLEFPFRSEIYRP